MKIEPYLNFDDDCRAAFSFYEQCLGGRIEAMVAHGNAPMADEVPSEWHGRIRPAVEGLLATDLRQDRVALVRRAVRANIQASGTHRQHGSEILLMLAEKDGLLVVGAEYSLETGAVEFFDGLPATG